MNVYTYIYLFINNLRAESYEYKTVNGEYSLDYIIMNTQ